MIAWCLLTAHSMWLQIAIKDWVLWLWTSISRALLEPLHLPSVRWSRCIILSWTSSESMFPIQEASTLPDIWFCTTDAPSCQQILHVLQAHSLQVPPYQCKETVWWQEKAQGREFLWRCHNCWYKELGQGHVHNTARKASYCDHQKYMWCCSQQEVPGTTVRMPITVT